MKKFFLVLTVGSVFSLAAFQKPDKVAKPSTEPEAVAAPEHEDTHEQRSLSAAPRAFFNLDDLEALSEQLKKCSLPNAPTSPTSAAIPQANPVNIFSIALSDREKLNQARRIRAAIRSITVQGMSPVHEEEATNVKRSFSQQEGSPEGDSSSTLCSPTSKSRKSSTSQFMASPSGHHSPEKDPEDKN